MGKEILLVLRNGVNCWESGGVGGGEREHCGN